MRIPDKKLLKLRSGHTVWRVLFYINSSGDFTHYVDQTPVLGKKVLHRFGELNDEDRPWFSLKMVCRKFKYKDCAQVAGQRCAHFLEDLKGHGCFSSYRSAQRFVKEVYDGYHPELVERVYEDCEDDRRMQDWLDERQAEGWAETVVGDAS